MTTDPLDQSEYRRLGKAIGTLDVGLRLDRYLARDFLFRSRNAWQNVIDDGEVLVNGRAMKASYHLALGDEVTYFRPMTSEPTVNKNISVLWEKDGVIAVFKPANLPMHEGGAYRQNTFCEVLKEKFGPQWAPTHRLDRETSGIVLCADNTFLRNHLSESFYRRRMIKKYLAIVFGKVPQQEWDVDQPIKQTKNTRFRIKYWVLPDGLASQTHFKVLESTDAYSLLEVSPRTGRTHQIRVHAAWSGFHLVGDKKYYPDESIYLEHCDNGFNEIVRNACLFDRLCLHATYLKFTHPGDGCTYEVTSEMPEDLKRIWKSLRGDTKPGLLM